MTIRRCGRCGTPHDSMADAMDCCAEEFDDDRHDDQGAAPVAMADGGLDPLDEPQTVPWRSGDRVFHTHRCANYQSASRTRGLRPGERQEFRRCRMCAGKREKRDTPDEPTAETLEKLDPDDLRADGGTPGGETDRDDDLVTDGGQTVRRRADDNVDARAETIGYLRDLVDPGDSHTVLARHVANATPVSSHKAGRVLARLAGQTDGIGPLDGSHPDDLSVEREWKGANAVRWRVHREDDDAA